MQIKMQIYANKFARLQLKNDVLNIGTSFYLPESDVDKLREAARILLEQSKEYHAALKALQ